MLYLPAFRYVLKGSVRLVLQNKTVHQIKIDVSEHVDFCLSKPHENDIFGVSLVGMKPS